MPKLSSVLLPLALSLAAAHAATNQLTPIPSTRYDHGVPAKSDLNDIVISAREMLVDVSYTDGRPRKGALLILFDPSSGFYSWEFGPVGLNEKTSHMTAGYGTIGIAHLASDRIVHFAFGPPFLMAHESLTKARDVDDAETKSIAEATGRLPPKLTHNMDDRVITNLIKFLPHEFFQACMGCSGPFSGKIVNIVHKGNTWELTLQGQWQEKVTLNEKYQVTGVVRVN